MLSEDDHARLVEDYRRESVMARAAAPVRDELTRLAAALADLSPTARFLIEDRLKHVHLQDLEARAGTTADESTRHMKGGGRRTIAQVMKHRCPRARLLIAVRTALAKYIPKPRNCEILAAAETVLLECGAPIKGLRHVLDKLA